MAPSIEIIHPNGARERHPLVGQQVVLGRQPRDGIAIPYAMELELEHLLLVPQREGCWLSVVQGARTPALVQGQRLDSGLITWGTEVNLGPLWFKVMDSPAAQDPAQAPSRSHGHGPGQTQAPRTSLTTVLMFGGLVLAAGWLLLSSGGDSLPEMTSVKPPALFTAPAPCPEKDPAAAQPRAHEAENAALAKSQRYPFEAQDGISAVELYGLARSCYLVAGRDAQADRVTHDRDALKSRITEDYRTHQLKLDRAIRYRRTRQALIESEKLLDLVKHLDHPYTTWLRSLERRLRLKVESKA